MPDSGMTLRTAVERALAELVLIGWPRPDLISRDARQGGRYVIEPEIDQNRAGPGQVRIEAHSLDPLKVKQMAALMLHGVRRNVEGEVKLRFAGGDLIEAEGERMFDIRDCGLEPPRRLMLKVYPEVEERGHVVAKKPA